MIPHPDPEHRKELSREAKELLRPDGALVTAILALEKQWYGTLLSAIDDGKEREIIARLRALKMIAPALQALINDQAIAENRMVSRVGRI